MLRSNINTERTDLNRVKTEEHIEQVWQVIEKNITTYFEKILYKGEDVASLMANSSFKIQSSQADLRKQLDHIFTNGLQSYRKEDKKYKDFFSEESMHEFEDEDDPKGFKSALSTKIPIILKARNSKRETMHEWQERFAASKAVEVYAIFFNLIDFMNEYIDEISEDEYGSYDDVTDLEKFYTLNEDEDYNVPGVIGMGIKSSILYYLNPTFFLGANKNTLYGYYFLSACDDFHLPSRSNEFIMINDLNSESVRRFNRNMLIDQNYWYPYDLFMFYGLRTYRKLKELCAKYNYQLDNANRFVHVNTFMSKIWEFNKETIATMTGGDQDDAR